MTEAGTEAAASLRASGAFYRAHGLGNDYLVFEAEAPAAAGWPVTPASVRRVCDRSEGVGSDGIVVLLDRTPEDGIFPLRMFNPDGSEFERSGNGLRVLASYLFREGLVRTGPFRVRSGGAVIPMTVHASGPSNRFDVSVQMGQAQVGIEAVMADPARMDPEGRIVHPSLGPIPFVPVTVGNPHAVIFPIDPSERLLTELGPFVSAHDAFPQGTNVQLVQLLGAGRIRIWIWERGAGRTRASGTSSCAAAVASVATGRLEPGMVEVEMEGGVLRVTVSPELDVLLRGPVAAVVEGRLVRGFLDELAATD